MDYVMKISVFVSLILCFSSSNVHGMNQPNLFKVTDYGALRNSKTDSSTAFMGAWSRACSVPNGQVLVPRGTFFVSGATFEGPCNGPTIFKMQGTIVASSKLSNQQYWIQFHGVDGLVVTGNGTFDGQGTQSWQHNKCTSKNAIFLPSVLKKMEKALVKVGSLKASTFWVSKKAKEEISNISQDLTTFSNTVEEKAKWVFNKLKGKPTKALPDLLRENNLPPGLFPQNITCYEYDESKLKLIVYLPSPCEVCFKDSSVVRYSTRVRCTLSRGKLSGIDGMKTKVVLVWVKVTSVNVEGYKSDKVWFTAGVKKSRSKDAYDMPRDGVKVEDF